jgi:hypothetical protein
VTVEQLAHREVVGNDRAAEPELAPGEVGEDPRDPAQKSVD